MGQFVEHRPMKGPPGHAADRKPFVLLVVPLRGGYTAHKDMKSTIEANHRFMVVSLPCTAT